MSSNHVSSKPEFLKLFEVGTTLLLFPSKGNFSFFNIFIPVYLQVSLTCFTPQENYLINSWYSFLLEAE
jgi:hypothetical protein